MGARTRNGMPGVYNDVLPTLSDGNGAALAIDSRGRLIVTIAADSIPSTFQFGTHRGALPPGVTAYFGQGEVGDNYIGLFIAPVAGTITRFSASSVTANGAAHTDTYTLVKQLSGGSPVDTLMTFAITNGKTGFTTANQVTVAVGDTIGIKVVTDAATAGADVTAGFTIESL